MNLVYRQALTMFGEYRQETLPHLGPIPENSHPIGKRSRAMRVACYGIAENDGRRTVAKDLRRGPE